VDPRALPAVLMVHVILILRSVAVSGHQISLQAAAALVWSLADLTAAVISANKLFDLKH
jgi:hypothetical protein